jgi:hypothetical protein
MCNEMNLIPSVNKKKILRNAIKLKMAKNKASGSKMEQNETCWSKTRLQNHNVIKTMNLIIHFNFTAQYSEDSLTKRIEAEHNNFVLNRGKLK